MILCVPNPCLPISITTANGLFETFPGHVGGVLSVCIDHEVFITCGHSNLNTGVTRWVLSTPVNCSEVIQHRNPAGPYQCGPFSFQDVTMLAPDAVLSSTAVATANTSMTGTTVECRDSAGINPHTIGSTTLCIFGK